MRDQSDLGVGEIDRHPWAYSIVFERKFKTLKIGVKVALSSRKSRLERMVAGDLQLVHSCMFVLGIKVVNPSLELFDLLAIFI